MVHHNSIENNPTYSKFRKEIEGADAIRKIVKFISYFGINNKDLNQALSVIPDLKKQIIDLSTCPDRFNKHFSGLGWIAHESMNSDLMENAINLADKGKLDDAERMLVDYYISTEIRWYLMRFKSIPEFSKRYELIEYAYNDTINKNYYSSVPLLLMIIDGAVNDIDKNKGFFTDTTDLTAWDSIAAHSSGLSVIRDIFNSSRNKTTTEKITLPYRNGILHGRDLGYANEFVVAKCWASLIAIKDWADAVKQGKKVSPEPEKNKTFKENLREFKLSLANYVESHKRIEETKDKIDKWKPRQIVLGRDVPITGIVSDFGAFTPEGEAIQFALYWKNKNYGNIAKQIDNSYKKDFNINLEAKRIRGLLDNKNLCDYYILKIEDKTPAISEITISVLFDYLGEKYEKPLLLRLICYGDGGQIAINGDVNCKWKLIDNLYFQLDIY